MNLTDMLQKLQGGDRRSIGRADEVVEEVLKDPSLLGAMFRGLLGDDPVLRLRCADVAEKVTAVHPEYLQEYKAALLQQVARIEQQEVRWHVAQMLPRLHLDAEERAEAVRVLIGYLSDKSSIVRTFSLQALADLAGDDAVLRPKVIEQLQQHIERGSPAVKARGRKLLAELQSEQGSTGLRV